MSSTARLPAWSLDPVPPPGWAGIVRSLGGGFFLTPPALRVGAADGVPLFCRLARGEETVGLALGVERRCSFGITARHHYFPGPPLLAPGEAPQAAVSLLLAELRSRGAAEVVFDSFGATDGLRWPEGGHPGRERREFVVDTDRGPDDLLSGFEPAHRSRIRRGEREGWKLASLEPEEGAALLRETLATAAMRAAARGDRMGVPAEAELRFPASDPAEPWGTRVFAALDGEVPLAAALIGWAGRSTYDLMGGSTADGYRRGAAPWLHWRLMRLFAFFGRTTYGFGGVGASAEQPEDPSHGLYLFKRGFRPRVVPCQGARWDLRPHHLRIHRLARWAASHLPAGDEA